MTKITMVKIPIDFKEIIEKFNKGENFFDNYSIYWKDKDVMFWEDWLSITLKQTRMLMNFNNCEFNFKLTFYSKKILR